MYKEYRDVTLTGAVAQMYLEVAGRHRGRASGVQIIKTAELTAGQCKREQTLQYHVSTQLRRLLQRGLAVACHDFASAPSLTNVSVGRHRTRRSPSRCRTGCCARHPSRSRAASTRHPGPTRFTESLKTNVKRHIRSLSLLTPNSVYLRPAPPDCVPWSLERNPLCKQALRSLRCRKVRHSQAIDVV